MGNNKKVKLRKEFEAGKYYYTRGGDIVQLVKVDNNYAFSVSSDEGSYLSSGHMFGTKYPSRHDLLLPEVTEDGALIWEDSWENSTDIEREPRFDEFVTSPPEEANQVTDANRGLEDELTALRYNSGKTDFTLLPVDALEAESKVWMMGMEKYGRNNWENLWGDETKNVVMQSAMRHMMAIMSGEDIDNESGQPHAAHVRCNMAMLIRYYNEMEKSNEDKK